MADIIKESGLSAGSIYSHFSSKEEILNATAQSAFETMREIFETRNGETVTPREMFTLLTQQNPLSSRLSTVLRFFAESSTNTELQKISNENILRAKATLTEVLTPWAQGQEGETAELLDRTSDQLMMIFHGFIVRTTVDQQADHSHLIKHGASLLPGE